MSVFNNQFRRIHFYVLWGLIAVFSTLTLGMLILQSPSDWRDNHNFSATVLVVSGPFTGAIARPSSSSTLGFSWALFPYCAGILLVGVLLQFVRLPFKQGARSIQMVFWVLSLLGWFGGGFVSLMYALS